jgi:hypothetical protein
MIDLQTASIMVASASVVAGVIYHALVIRHQTKIRQTDLIMRLYSTFDSREFQEAWTRMLTTQIKDFDDYSKKYNWTDASCLFLFFEEVGILFMMKLIDVKLVNRLLGDPILMTWEKGKPLVEGFRDNFHNPEIFWQFEYLYNEIKKREQHSSAR